MYIHSCLCLCIYMAWQKMNSSKISMQSSPKCLWILIVWRAACVCAHAQNDLKVSLLAKELFRSVAWDFQTKQEEDFWTKCMCMRAKTYLFRYNRRTRDAFDEICVYVCIRVCSYTRTRTFSWSKDGMLECVCAYVCVCTYAHLYNIFMEQRWDVRMCIYVYLCVHVRTFIFAWNKQIE
jgi:hypothetical protein